MAQEAGPVGQWKEYDLTGDEWQQHADVVQPMDAEAGAGPSPGAAAGGLEEIEVDVRKMAQRQKQIDFGKNTLGYTNYLQQVPLEARINSGKNRHPETPDIMQRISKRQFDGQVKAWRRALHKYDPSFGAGQGAEAVPLATAPQPKQPGQQAGDCSPPADKKRGYSNAFSASKENASGSGASRRRASPGSPVREPGGAGRQQQRDSQQRSRSSNGDAGEGRHGSWRSGRGSEYKGRRSGHDSGADDSGSAWGRETAGDRARSGRGGASQRSSDRGPGLAAPPAADASMALLADKAAASKPEPLSVAKQDVQVARDWQDDPEDDVFGEWVDVCQEV